MRYLIEHRSRFEFGVPVSEHQCELRLAPRENEWQRLVSLQIEIEPEAKLFEYVDSFRNRVHHFSVLPPHEELTTVLHACVDSSLENPFDYPIVPPGREREWLVQRLRSEPSLWGFVLHKSPRTPRIERLADGGLDFPHWDESRPLLDAVRAAMRWVRGMLAHDPAEKEAKVSLSAVLEARAGICEDFAHLLVSIVRAWQVPARFVYGYRHTGEEEGAAGEGNDPHAWAEVLIPGAGWRGFDPVTDLVANDTYVGVSVGRDAGDAAPLRSAFKGGAEQRSPEVSLRVQREQ